MENWKEVKGFEGLYQVSDLGRVRSLDRWCNTKGNVKQLRKGRILRPKVSKSGYYNVTLSKDAESTMMRLHRVVAMTFIPNPDNLPYVNHKDEDKANNSVSNLEWCNQEYNVNYGTRTQRMIDTQIENGRFSGLPDKERRRRYKEEHKEEIRKYNKEYKARKRQII